MNLDPIRERSLLVLGGTGLVGAHLVRLGAARADVATVTAPVRRLPAAPPRGTTRAVRWLELDFSQLEGHQDLFAVNAVVCALGTTRAQAGSQEAFETVDLELPLRAARLARESGAERFGLVSSTGADEASPIAYLRTKGRLETALADLGFPVLVIVRPSLLLGARADRRRGEALAQSVLGPLRGWVPSAWRPVPAECVAERLLSLTLAAKPGVHRLENAALHR